jgi:hypothetical protein
MEKPYAEISGKRRAVKPPRLHWALIPLINVVVTAIVWPVVFPPETISPGLGLMTNS